VTSNTPDEPASAQMRVDAPDGPPLGTALTQAPPHSRSRTRRFVNHFLQRLAFGLPGATSVRPFLHRMRGVNIGKDVFIGEDVIIESEYPERVEIGDGSAIAMRSVVVAHFQGPGTVVIGKHVHIAPMSFVGAFKDETLRIGDGAAIGVGSVVRKDVPPGVFVAGSPARAKMRVTVPYSADVAYEAFKGGMVELTAEERQKLDEA
jgi:acetyltransferase-like isoleucine patch superfamily enzyme